MGTDVRPSAFSSSVAAPSSASSFAQPTSTYHQGDQGKTPSSSHYASFSSSSSSMSAYSNASSSAPKTPTSSYRPSYAMVASPEYTSSYQSKTPQHNGNTAGRYTSVTPGSAKRGLQANASMSAMTPITPITRSFHGAGDMDFDDLSPIRPSAGGQLYPSLPTTTPTVDLRYKHLLGNSPAQPAAARGAAPPAFGSLYPSSSSYSSSASSSSFSSSTANSKYSSSAGPSSTASSSAPTYSSSSSYASSLPALSSTSSTAWSSAPAAQAPTPSSSSKALSPASRIPTVTEQEYNGCAGFLRYTHLAPPHTT